MMQQLHGSYIQPPLREPHTFPPGSDVGLPNSGSEVLSHDLEYDLFLISREEI